jgi:hypothetical protein
MLSFRRAAWFFTLALALSVWMGALGSLRGVAEAGVIASHGGGGDLRAADIAKVQAFLERKVVLQKLMDYGVSPDEAMAKIRSMSEKDLHRLASLTDRAAEGADGLGLAIGLAVLVILVLVILMLMNKRVVVR